MNWPTAVVIMSGFLAGALVLSRPAAPQSPGALGTWTGVGMEGNWGWVVNTTTGQVKACHNSGPALVCKLSP
jgi:hypothetical protein